MLNLSPAPPRIPRSLPRRCISGPYNTHKVFLYDDPILLSTISEETLLKCVGGDTASSGVRIREEVKNEIRVGNSEVTPHTRSDVSERGSDDGEIVDDPDVEVNDFLVRPSIILDRTSREGSSEPASVHAGKVQVNSLPGSVAALQLSPLPGVDTIASTSMGAPSPVSAASPSPRDTSTAASAVTHSFYDWRVDSDDGNTSSYSQAYGQGDGCAAGDLAPIDVVVQELRRRHKLRDLERAAWLYNVVIPIEEVCFPSPTAEVELLRKTFRLNLCSEMFQQFVYLETIRRIHHVVTPEESSFRKILAMERKQRREVTGFDPIRRAMLNFVYRRRASRFAAARRSAAHHATEQSCRSNIVTEERKSWSTLVSSMIEAQESLYRIEIIKFELAISYVTAFSLLWQSQRCDLFQICFASPLLGAPRMSGRVCGHSLFHNLSVSEAFARHNVEHSRDEFMKAMAASLESAWMTCRVEPLRRKVVEESEEERRNIVWAIRTQVIWSYQRREVEFVESDGRRMVSAESERSFTSARERWNSMRPLATQ